MSYTISMPIVPVEADESVLEECFSKLEIIGPPDQVEGAPKEAIKIAAIELFKTMKGPFVRVSGSGHVAEQNDCVTLAVYSQDTRPPS